MHKAYVDTPLGQVHYRSGGAGTPLLLIHMTPQSSLQFEHAAPLLIDAGMQVIAPDMPGYGASDVPASAPTIQQYAETLPYLLDALGVEQAVVAGHHTGAATACELANMLPDRISRVVLHGVPWYSDEERAERLANLHVDSTPKADGSHLTDRWNWIWGRVGGVASLEACQMSAVHTFWLGDKEAYGHEAIFRYDMTPALKALEQPTLVLSNTGDPLHYVVERLKEFRSDLSFQEIDGGTVFFIWDEPKRWVEGILDFVKD